MAMNMARLEVFSQSHHYNRVKRLTVLAALQIRKSPSRCPILAVAVTIP
jgi:hypothetical protein